MRCCSRIRSRCDHFPARTRSSNSAKTEPGILPPGFQPCRNILQRKHIGFIKPCQSSKARIARYLTTLGAVVLFAVFHDQVKVGNEFINRLVVFARNSLLHFLQVHRLTDLGVIVRSKVLVDRIEERPSVRVILDLLQNFVHSDLGLVSDGAQSAQ